MGLDDLVDKGKAAMNSEHGEQASDKGIAGAGDAFDSMSGGRFAEHTDRVQEHVDGAVGQGDQQARQEQQQ
ncbi:MULTISPECIES: Rv0909 family putative TA system antitoxin [Agrococcus]|uniref:Antitoxin n=1 Tax=Agrococcus pavilionensis RW1 TaxID=1330458 RepID=U1LNI2_9MICO|nr:MULTISPECIES: Rv0909 family putative TA system antitoxin [Agrococcus]ERG63924.1 hypothetical protein L332_05560 [Agrococcus pavilionensis RW1]MBO1769753.1 antitoxin [Agrococcus sp. TF02-05]